jgi:esterase
MPARLHHELVAGTAPARWLALAHGIYGAGNNLRALAKKLVDRRPEWGIALVDLRLHGRSDAGTPPHTISACADDVRALVGELAAGGRRVDAIAGHSFGGKVALAARALVDVRQTWMLDASPSARPRGMADPRNSVAQVLEVMERLPRTWARRDDFIAAVVAAGQTRTLAQWLAMNVVPDATGQLALRLDLPAVRALLSDYFVQDLWPSLYDPTRGEVVIVIAERSLALDADDRARLATAPPHVHAEYVDSEHWLHVDAVDAVVDLFARRLP